MANASKRALFSSRGKRISRTQAQYFLKQGKNPVVKNAAGKKSTLNQILEKNDYKLPGTTKPIVAPEIARRFQYYAKRLKENNNPDTQKELEKALKGYQAFAFAHPKQAERMASLLNNNTGRIRQSRFFYDLDMNEILNYDVDGGWFWY